MIAVANKKTSTVSSHLGEQGKVRNEIVQKRKTVMEKLYYKKQRKVINYIWWLVITDFFRYGFICCGFERCCIDYRNNLVNYCGM